MLKYILLLLSFTCVMAAPPSSSAAGHEEARQEEAQKQEQPKAVSARAAITSRHKVRIGGGEISYTAAAGELAVANDAGETEATIFYTSYRAEPEKGKPRPLLFVFNGGPGAASVWLHLGALGPRRVQMLPDGNMPAPPFQLVDNAYSWLDVADLVFVDPIGTGYSRAAKPELAKRFTAVQGDIEILGRFIRLYLTRNQRWGAPIFLVGESYGSFRCAGLAEYLAEHGTALNGIMLISCVMNMQTLSFDFGNDLPYQLFLPSYTATAWYHHRLAPELQADLDETLKRAESWAATEYQTALNKGDRLTPQERALVTEKLAALTGLSSGFVASRNLRIDSRDFVRELLLDKGRMVGMMDSRFTAENHQPGKGPVFDPTVATIRPPFTTLLNKYVREELGFESDLEYFTLGGGIGRWDWEAGNSYADSSENLRNTMAKNPHMMVFIASGLFDLATPHFATEYTVSHLGISPDLKRNITTHRYRAGHMMYLEAESLVQLKKDAAAFIAKAVGPEQGRR